MANSNGSVLDTLLASDEPSIRWKARVGVLGDDPESKSTRALRNQIRTSPRVTTLLKHRDSRGRITRGRSVYDKWQGAHWIMASLADLGYPEGDADLHPVRDQILDTWLHEDFYKEFEAARKEDAYKKPGVCVMEGRHRRCASQQGYALYFIMALGLENARVHDLVERLMRWRWPDGGWNCDKEPAHESRRSFTPFTACAGSSLTAGASTSQRRWPRRRRRRRFFFRAGSSSADLTAR